MRAGVGFGIYARMVGTLPCELWAVGDWEARFVRTWRTALDVWKLAALTAKTHMWYMFPGLRFEITTAVSVRFDSPAFPSKDS